MVQLFCKLVIFLFACSISCWEKHIIICCDCGFVDSSLHFSQGMLTSYCVLPLVFNLRTLGKGNSGDHKVSPPAAQVSQGMSCWNTDFSEHLRKLGALSLNLYMWFQRLLFPCKLAIPEWKFGDFTFETKMQICRLTDDMRNREDEGKALSLDHVVTTLNWEDRSMHSELILSPVQTLSLTSALCLGLPWHRHGVSVHLSSPNLENGKKNDDPLLGSGNGQR